MSLFDVYIAVDFSGSKETGRQKASIALAELAHGIEPDVRTECFTRFDVVLYLLQRIFYHNSQGRRVLCGFDFSYAFPQGFWSSLTGRTENWGEVIRDITEGIPQLPAISEKPESNARQWAATANKNIAHKLGTSTGPFWGPGFEQLKDPHFPYSKAPFKEYRLAEKKLSSFQPIFKLGGNGSVGLQSLCGIPFIHNIRTTCVQQKVPLHCWPFDGWDLEASSHVLLEFYPALFNDGIKSHASDALACVTWAMQQDSQGKLQDFFCPGISGSEKAQASVEGWVLGIL